MTASQAVHVVCLLGLVRLCWGDRLPVEGVARTCNIVAAAAHAVVIGAGSDRGA